MKQFFGVLSNDLYLENKTYKLKRSIASKAVDACFCPSLLCFSPFHFSGQLSLGVRWVSAEHGVVTPDLVPLFRVLLCLLQVKTVPAKGVTVTGFDRVAPVV